MQYPLHRSPLWWDTSGFLRPQSIAIDWNNPIADQLIALHTPVSMAPNTMFNLTGFGSRMPRLFGTPTCAISPLGLAHKYTTGLHGFSHYSGWPTVAANEPFTLDVIVYLTSISARAHFYSLGSEVDWDDTNGTRRGLIAFGGGSNLNIYFWGDGADLNSGVAWTADGTRQHVTVTSGGSGTPMNFYRNRSLIASGTTPTLAATGNTSSIGNQIHGGQYIGSGTNAPVGLFVRGALWLRELSMPEVIQLHTRPWMMFRPTITRAAARGTVVAQRRWILGTH